MQIQTRKQTKIKVYNVVLNYIQNHDWVNYDGFADDFTDEILDQFEKENFDLEKILDKTKASFLQLNKVKKDLFLNDTFVNSILKSWHKAIKYSVPFCRFTDIFPELVVISDLQARSLLDKLDMSETIIQNGIRDALREKGATPIAQRTADSPLEVAEPEHFNLKIKGIDFGFAAVVKGYNSITDKKVSWKNTGFQITRAYRTHPDYILFISAKEPVDGFVTDFTTYGSDVGNPNLVIFVPPMDLVKFLKWRQII